MATKKDLVEAYSFSRRRLVTAFVSGAPGGREVEPNRPGRTIVGGIALAILLVAGGAVLGILKSPSNIEWDTPGFVTDKGTSADYLIMNRVDGESGTELRPLLNITSAMLVFGPDLEVQTASSKEIKKRKRGAQIGILGAPATPPTADSLVQDGWTGCADPDHVRITIAADPQVERVPTSRFVVRSANGTTYVIAQSKRGAARGERAYAYAVPSGEQSAPVLSAVAGTSEPVSVPDQWVQLFPPGDDLVPASLGLGDDVGQPWPKAGSVPGARDARIGSILQAGDASYLLTGTGKGAIKLDPFSLAYWQDVRVPGKPQGVIEVDAGPQAFVEVNTVVDWPTDKPPAYDEPQGQLCAQLDVRGDQPNVLLATTPADSSAAAPTETDTDDPVSTDVDSGVGAFVMSGDWNPGGEVTPALVDDQGIRYPVGPGVERTNLGYDGVADVTVPDVWLDLLTEGVPLTQEAALCAPSPTLKGTCS